MSWDDARFRRELRAEQAAKVPTSLSRTVPRPKTPEWELEEFRRRAWIFDGVACLHIDRITDDWLRAAVTNYANKEYGPRKLNGDTR